MTRRSSALIAVCLGVLAAGSVHGQARNATLRDPDRKPQVRADPAAEHAAKLTQIDSWLRKLVGQFRLSVDGTSLAGMADCSGIGTGPGVHCVFSIGPARQRDQWENAVMLFGIDTEGPRVHRFQINRDSTAEMGVSPVRGNTVTFQVGDCPVIQHYPPDISIGRVRTFTVLSCRREARVYVGPDGRSVRIQHSTFERVLVRPPYRPPPPLSEIREFESVVNWTLEREQTQQGTSAVTSRLERLTSPAGESPSVIPQAPPVDPLSTGEELDEVLVAGSQPLGNRDDIAMWLQGLAGSFRIEGTLNVDGGLLPVAGMTDCVSVGGGPGMNCVIRLRAPNIDTHLEPGAFILGIDLETPTVRYTSVDDTGVGVGATGSLWGDTAVFHTPCKSSSARICTTTTRISAQPDSDSVRLQIEINMDGRTTASYDVLQVRIR